MGVGIFAGTSGATSRRRKSFVFSERRIYILTLGRKVEAFLCLMLFICLQLKLIVMSKADLEQHVPISFTPFTALLKNQFLSSARL